MPRKAKSTEKEEKVLIEETKEIKPKKETKKKVANNTKKEVEKKAVTKSKAK